MPDNSAPQIWEAALGQLQLQVTRPSYDTWLRDTVGLSFEENQLTVGAPSTFVAEWLEKRMIRLVQDAVDAVVKSPTTVAFLVQGQTGGGGEPEDLPADHVTSVQPRTMVSPSAPRFSINTGFTFDTFVVGEASRLAHAAAQAVAAQPGAAYNPFLIYGGVGLGKTHLLHAIAHEVVRRGLRPFYVTTEQFTNDFISAIRNKRTEEFRTKYRSVDVLLIDDIQFIAGKEQTQEGFFHTFNDLHNGNRQIVITSDRHPNTLPLLEARLRSRFQGGLIADIQPPDWETRMAILRSKAEHHRVPVDDAILEYLATNIHSNVRLLEGSLTRLAAFADLTHSRIDLALTGRVLGDLLLNQRSAQAEPSSILQAVAAHFNLRTGDLCARGRDKRSVEARQVSIYLLREDARLPLQEIGRVLGNRDHSTILHSLRRASRDVERDLEIRQAVLAIRRTLEGEPSPMIRTL